MYSRGHRPLPLLHATGIHTTVLNAVEKLCNVIEFHPPRVMPGACTPVQGEYGSGDRITPMLFPACRKGRLNGAWWASVVTSIQRQYVRYDALQESRVPFTGGASLKEFAMRFRQIV